MNKKGFTLVELLVAIVIMGIVTAIAFPAISGLKTENDYKRYKSLAGVLRNGAKIYAEDNKYNLGDCTKVSYTTLKEDNYVKNNQISVNENCNASHVYVIKTNNKFRYYPIIICNSVEKYKDATPPTTCD